MPEVLTLSALADAEPDLSTFENKTGLAEDMKFLASMPELCDVTFLVGDTREPVCAVKAVLASRSRVFQKMLYQAPSPQRKKDPPPRENKLRLFLKRSSEPLLNLQNAAQQRSGFSQQLPVIPEIRVVNILNRYSDLKDVRVPILTTHHVGKVSQFHKSLKARFGKTLADLQTSCLNDKDINFVQFLQEIANEHQFEVTYVDIEEKTYSGRCQCLVQLSTLPVAVCQGSGTTIKDAQNHAARNALEYLKIMTKM